MYIMTHQLIWDVLDWKSACLMTLTFDRSCICYNKSWFNGIFMGNSSEIEWWDRYDKFRDNHEDHDSDEMFSRSLTSKCKDANYYSFW